MGLAAAMRRLWLSGQGANCAVSDALYRLVMNSQQRPNVARFVPGEQTRTPHQERHVGGDEAAAVLNYIERDLI
jgi:hypothetical protein